MLTIDLWIFFCWNIRNKANLALDALSYDWIVVFIDLKEVFDVRALK